MRNSNNLSTWAVVGASGFIGAATVKHLREQGYSVREIKAPRISEGNLNLAQSAQDLASSFSKEINVLVEELDGCEILVNAAGLAMPDAKELSRELVGANSILPALMHFAAHIAGVRKFIHLSSAAVQGDIDILNEDPTWFPFSPYSQSKADGEKLLLRAAEEQDTPCVGILRATSVQGAGRKTTQQLEKIARSIFASVASPGNQPSIVSTVEGLAKAVHEFGISETGHSCIAIQPWEGLSVSDVVEKYGNRKPFKIPAVVCRVLVAMLKSLPSDRFKGIGRRIEVFWFGQKQVQSILEASQD